MSSNDLTFDICNALQAAIDAMEELEDREGTSASQATSTLVDDLFQEFDDLATSKGYIRRKSNGGRRSAAASPDPQDGTPIPEPEQDPSTPRPKTTEEIQAAKDLKVQKLTILFCGKQGLLQATPSAVRDLLCDEPSGDRRSQELQAVQRFLCGLEWADQETWASVFDDFLSSQPVSLSAHRLASMKCDREGDRMTRLLMRHQVLSTQEAQGVGYRIAQSILSKIDSLRFAEDWNLLSQGEKSNWLDQAYIQAHPKGYANLAPRAVTAALERESEDVKSWKKEVGRVTTARNRLLRMYLTYGAMIILDPVWNLRALRNHQGAQVHRALMALPSKLFRTREEEHPLQRFQPATEHALVCVAELVAGQEVAFYVNEFLDEFSPQLLIPRHPGFE